MKKIVTVMMAVVLMLSLSVSAFALESPVAEEKVKAVLVMGDKAPVRATVKDNNQIEIEADSAQGEFQGWSFFLSDGTAATEGIHYEFITGDASGKARTATAVIVAKTDLIIVANYANQTPDMTAAVALIAEQDSPTTGDVATVSLAVVMIVALGGIVVAKKRLAA